jgi:hypothetical protein
MMQTNACRTFPDQQISIDTEIQYDWNEDVTVGFGYEYLDAGETVIDQEGGTLTRVPQS